jgi:hypothetical protein
MNNANEPAFPGEYLDSEVMKDLLAMRGTGLSLTMQEVGRLSKLGKGLTKREELAARMMAAQIPDLVAMLKESTTPGIGGAILLKGAQIANAAADALLKSWEE